MQFFAKYYLVVGWIYATVVESRKTAVVVTGGFSPIAGRFESSTRVVDENTKMFVRMVAASIRRNILEMNQPSIVIIHSWNPELRSIFQDEYNNPVAAIYEDNSLYKTQFMQAPGCKQMSSTCWRSISWAYSAYRGVQLAAEQPNITHVILVRPDVLYTKPINGFLVNTKIAVGIPKWTRRGICGDFFYIFSLEAAINFVHMYTLAMEEQPYRSSTNTNCVIGCVHNRKTGQPEPDRQCFKSIYIKQHLNMSLDYTSNYVLQPLDLNIYRNLGITGGNCHFLLDYQPQKLLALLSQINFTATHLQAVLDSYEITYRRKTKICPRLVNLPTTSDFRRSIEPILIRLSSSSEKSASVYNVQTSFYLGDERLVTDEARSKKR